MTAQSSPKATFSKANQKAIATPVLQGPPHPDLVIALKGQIDFYYWRGLAVARSWPRRPQLPRSPAVQAAAAQFADVINRTQNVAPIFRNAALRAAQGSAWTWRDCLVSATYGSLSEVG